ncbi:polysaccharide deacetylase family protein [Rhodoferax sp.]|uniref:polysaccharide deacetylase family protein n=1 Tax=Rhodoferax sp. TaxID=50421 RepID=UPI00283D3166|nr:polysaccharide deacetylase family protein [Rhodoferax sp.]MDR3370193.1 polysaccharide deacetylase family protein [Rhodoferax sp.]
MPSDFCAPVEPIPILVYHQIAEAPPKGAPFRSLYVSPKSFARQMRLLKWLGYRGLSMSALLPYLRGEKRGKVCGITFDDGFVNNLEHAMPVLHSFGFSSTCYNVSQRLGQTNDWDREVGIAPAPLMTSGQLKEWLAHGQEVGAHTRHHVHLPLLSEEDCVHEIAGSLAELRDVCHVNVDHFCYPYGEFKPEHAAMVKRAGYLTATTTERARCKTGDDLWQLPRVPVVRSTTLPVFWLKLATAYEDRRRD